MEKQSDRVSLHPLLYFFQMISSAQKQKNVLIIVYDTQKSVVPETAPKHPDRGILRGMIPSGIP